jgi:hypothetical protein
VKFKEGRKGGRCLLKEEMITTYRARRRKKL